MAGSDGAGDGVTGVGEQKAQCEGDYGIEEEEPETRVVEEKVILVGEGGEGGEASAEAGDQQSPHLRRDGDAAVDQTEQ